MELIKAIFRRKSILLVYMNNAMQGQVAVGTVPNGSVQVSDSIIIPVNSGDTFLAVKDGDGLHFVDCYLFRYDGDK